MKYVAIYDSAVAVEAAKHAALKLLKKDHYYPKTHDASKFGTNGIVKWNGKNYRILDTEVEDLDELNEDILDQVDVVSWVSCEWNRIEYDFTTENEVKVTIEGRRHGIPCRALEGVMPREILEYTSQEPDWSVWDTRDDHR